MSEKFYKKYKKGLLVGLVFGIAGIWLLSLLSLISPFFELITAPLFAPGKWLSSVLVTGDSAGDGVVALFFLFNGILYALVGALVQALVNRFRK